MRKKLVAQKKKVDMNKSQSNATPIEDKPEHSTRKVEGKLSLEKPNPNIAAQH